MNKILARRSSGFTLIELLIVIALLGALAVGLIGALDPFEQLKKGTDTGTRDLVNQIQTAIIRYYSVKTAMPWCPTGVGCSEPNQSDLLDTVMDDAIDNMIAAGELKSDFKTIQSANLTKVLVTGSSVDNTAIVCYKPTAKAFQADPNTKFDKAGAPGTDCKSTGGSTDCYWCIQ